MTTPKKDLKKDKNWRRFVDQPEDVKIIPPKKTQGSDNNAR